jgi:lysophospholipase L1-like esterase
VNDRGDPVRIVGLGDSTTAGTPGFLSPLEAPPAGRGNVESQYAHWLGRAHPEWELFNRGVNGERSDQILARFERDVVALHPAAVVVIAGVNDVYQGRDEAAVERSLESMYRRAHEVVIAVVAGTILPYNTATPQENGRMHAVNAWIRSRAACGAGIAFCDTRAAVARRGDADLLESSPDGLHPGVAGYRRMGEAIAPVLAALLADGR